MDIPTSLEASSSFRWNQSSWLVISPSGLVFNVPVPICRWVNWFIQLGKPSGGAPDSEAGDLALWDVCTGKSVHRGPKYGGFFTWELGSQKQSDGIVWAPGTSHTLR